MTGRQSALRFWRGAIALRCEQDKLLAGKYKGHVLLNPNVARANMRDFMQKPGKLGERAAELMKKGWGG